MGPILVVVDGWGVLCLVQLSQLLCLLSGAVSVSSSCLSHCHLCLSLLSSDSSHLSICSFIYPGPLREKVPGRPDLTVERVELLHPTED